MPAWLREFVRESNRIEGILRDPLAVEVQAHERFLRACPSVETLAEFVVTVQPGARLRDEPGLDVRVGDHRPPPGGPGIRDELEQLLAAVTDVHPYHVHHRYETLHPFTDGNGRSGQVLWLWDEQRAPSAEWRQVKQLGFLHAWYYQSLQFSREPVSL